MLCLKSRLHAGFLFDKRVAVLRARGSRVSSRMGPERKPEQRRAVRSQDDAAPSRDGVYRSRKPRARDACEQGYRRAFSCERRYFCPRCQKRVLP